MTKRNIVALVSPVITKYAKGSDYTVKGYLNFLMKDAFNDMSLLKTCIQTQQDFKDLYIYKPNFDLTPITKFTVSEGTYQTLRKLSKDLGVPAQELAGAIISTYHDFYVEFKGGNY